MQGGGRCWRQQATASVLSHWLYVIAHAAVNSAAQLHIISHTAAAAAAAHLLISLLCCPPLPLLHSVGCQLQLQGREARAHCWLQGCTGWQGPAAGRKYQRCPNLSFKLSMSVSDALHSESYLLFRWRRRRRRRIAGLELRRTLLHRLRAAIAAQWRGTRLLCPRLVQAWCLCCQRAAAAALRGHPPLHRPAGCQEGLMHGQLC